MKIAISNIAWQPEEDDAVAVVLTATGVSAVEVAPTKTWPDLTAVGPKDAEAEARRWAALGLDVVAVQSLLFGRPELLLFGSDEDVKETLTYLEHVLRLGAAMGARVHVFGSPKNRRRGSLLPAALEARAIEVFGRLGRCADELGTTLCLEANPEQYGADFVTRAHEAATLVRAVDERGFRLHLDSACMQLAGDDIGAIVRANVDILSHVHMSVPFLGPVGDHPRSPAHETLVRALADAGYAGYVSVEMRPTPSNRANAVRVAAEYATSLVGDL